MGVVRVQSEKLIARPIEVVRAQFVDMQHHTSTSVHTGLNVSNVRMQQGGCRFTGRRQVLGMQQEDEIEVLRSADGNSTLRSLAGSNQGLLISQNFESMAPELTRVRTSVELPVRGILSLLAPLLRLGLKRDLDIALEEDRRDLEERGYQING